MAISGGTELNAVRTVEQLVSRGHSVITATLTSATDGMTQRYEAAGSRVMRFPVTGLVGYNAVTQVRRVAEMLRQERVDIVHTHDCFTNFLMVPAARLAGVPVVASKRWIRHVVSKYRYTDLVAFGLADRILANSEAVARTLVDEDYVASSKISVVHNFIDPDYFSARDSRDMWRTRFGFSDQDLVVGIVAQLREEKNHAVLIDAFARLVSIVPAARLLVVGDGPERARIETLVSSSGLGTCVVLAGHVPRAGLCYAAADVAVLPSQHEGFPNSVVEAMAVGVPVVGSNVGGIPDAIVAGETGYLVPVGDSDALCKRLAELLSDATLRRRMSAAGRQRALDRYQAASALSTLEQLYAALHPSP
ncbi:MAG: glycosyltransferase family 4 protein [Gemmatimonadaceae bacterium]|nr:glycosyltransferase family 4 protein [Gemmatimonadaceae bacterium]